MNLSLANTLRVKRTYFSCKSKKQATPSNATENKRLHLSSPYLCTASLLEQLSDSDCDARKPPGLERELYPNHHTNSCRLRYRTASLPFSCCSHIFEIYNSSISALFERLLSNCTITAAYLFPLNPPPRRLACQPPIQTIVLCRTSHSNRFGRGKPGTIHSAAVTASRRWDLDV